jgi:hypothetical protein
VFHAARQRGKDKERWRAVGFHKGLHSRLHLSGNNGDEEERRNNLVSCNHKLLKGEMVMLV